MGMSPIAVRISTDSLSPSLMPSSARSRSASSATNADRGGAASPVRRSASKGSVTIASFRVDAAIGLPRPNQQRLGGVGRAVEQLGDVRYGETVDVTERERGAVVSAERVEHLGRAQPVEADVPRVVLELLILLERVVQALVPGAAT